MSFSEAGFGDLGGLETTDGFEGGGDVLGSCGNGSQSLLFSLFRDLEMVNRGEAGGRGCRSLKWGLSLGGGRTFEFGKLLKVGLTG